MVEFDTRFKPVEHITIASGEFSQFQAFMNERGRVRRLGARASSAVRRDGLAPSFPGQLPHEMALMSR
jgi:hypothetical protein